MGAQLPSRRSSRRHSPMAEINVTPFVDVMLVLLIIFMVTAPLLVAGVPVDLPESRAKSLDQDSTPRVLSIDSSGAVFIGDSEVTPTELPDALAALRDSLPPEQQLFLRADADLNYGAVMKVMGELNRAGLNRVALVSVGIGDGAAVSGGSSASP